MDRQWLMQFTDRETLDYSSQVHEKDGASVPSWFPQHHLASNPDIEKRDAAVFNAWARNRFHQGELMDQS